MIESDRQDLYRGLLCIATTKYRSSRAHGFIEKYFNVVLFHCKNMEIKAPRDKALGFREDIFNVFPIIGLKQIMMHPGCGLYGLQEHNWQNL